MKYFNFQMMKSAVSSLEVTGDLNSFSSLKIHQQDNVSSYYIPFDAINQQAKIVLVGITPGKTQLINAVLAAQAGIKKGLDDQEVLKQAKEIGAFSGILRTNLVKLLDFVGLNEILNISTTHSLFHDHSHLLHSTSVLRHPVFVDDKNYSGTTPHMLKHSLLKQLIELYFFSEIEQLPNALYIPLGPKVEEILQYCINNGKLNERQILFGIPHPSGANAERIKYFLQEKEKSLLSVKVNADKIDTARSMVLQKIKNVCF